jgi:hypothetical protein
LTELQWKPVVFLPVNLTVRFDALVLTGDDPAGWCRSKASGLLGAGADRRQVRKLTQCLEDYATYLRNKDLPTTAALFFYPDFTRIPPRAYAEIFVVGPDPEIGPMTLARARELCGPDERTFGEIEMTEVEAPAGPALRVHRYRKADPHKRRTQVIEELDWVICPPDSTQAVMMITTWGEPAFSKAATTIADDMAKNFRIDSPN